MNMTMEELKALTDKKALVAVYLRHGLRLSGKLVGQDEKSLFLEDSMGIQMILKNAVSKVEPIS